MSQEDKRANGNVGGEEPGKIALLPRNKKAKTPKKKRTLAIRTYRRVPHGQEEVEQKEMHRRG